MAAEALRVVKAERDRREKALEGVDPDPAYDIWLFKEEPFLNELCLAVLIGIRHQLERELLLLSARVVDASTEMTRAKFAENVQSERALLRGSGGWSRLEKRLNLKAFPEWGGSLDLLRLIVNSLKHDPWSTPEAELLKRLNLSESANYAPFAESGALREGLLSALDLSASVGWCEVAEEFLVRADQLVHSVASQPIFAEIKRGPASIHPDEFLR